jgi:hypothetical protein
MLYLNIADTHWSITSMKVILALVAAVMLGCVDSCCFVKRGPTDSTGKCSTADEEQCRALNIDLVAAFNGAAVYAFTHLFAFTICFPSRLPVPPHNTSGSRQLVNLSHAWIQQGADFLRVQPDVTVLHNHVRGRLGMGYTNKLLKTTPSSRTCFTTPTRDSHEMQTSG